MDMLFACFSSVSYLLLEIMSMLRFALLLLLLSFVNIHSFRGSVFHRYNARISCTKKHTTPEGSKPLDTSTGDNIKKPHLNVVRPFLSESRVEKFLMIYTCKLCTGRNSQMVAKVAYNHGMVVSTCKQCNASHLIADNERNMGFPDKYGKRIEDYLIQQGERVQKVVLTEADLQKYHLVDRNGELQLISKETGQLPSDGSIIEYPTTPTPSDNTTSVDDTSEATDDDDDDEDSTSTVVT